MNNSTLTIQAVGLGACAEVLSRFCFPGCTLKKGYSPSLSVGVLFLGFQSDDLFTGVVAPTTCSLTICLTTCMYVRFRRKSWVEYVRFRRKGGILYGIS